MTKAKLKSHAPEARQVRMPVNVTGDSGIVTDVPMNVTEPGGCNTSSVGESACCCTRSSPG